MYNLSKGILKYMISALTEQNLQLYELYRFFHESYPFDEIAKFSNTILWTDNFTFGCTIDISPSSSPGISSLPLEEPLSICLFGI